MNSVSEFLSYEIAEEREASSNRDALDQERMGVGIDRGGKEGLRALHINMYEIKTGMLSSLLIEGH